MRANDERCREDRSRSRRLAVSDWVGAHATLHDQATFASSKVFRRRKTFRAWLGTDQLSVCSSHSSGEHARRPSPLPVWLCDHCLARPAFVPVLLTAAAPFKMSASIVGRDRAAESGRTACASPSSGKSAPLAYAPQSRDSPPGDSPLSIPPSCYFSCHALQHDRLARDRGAACEVRGL
jgi:hypothetical protein